MKSLIRFILLCSILTACSREKLPTGNQEARILFSQSAELISVFISEINIAKDSVTLDSLQQIFEKNITDLNFKFPPETDLKLTEEENDSLFYLLNQLKQSLYNKKRELIIVPVDSLDLN